MLEAPDTESRSSTWQWVRWAVAILLVAGVALLAAASQLPKSCEEEAIDDAGGKVEVCRTAEITDPVPVLALIGVGVLLWPDLAEVTGLGITVRRRVEAATEKANQAKASADRALNMLTLQATRFDQAVNSSQTSNIYLVDSPSSEETARRVERFRSGASRLDGGEPESLPPIPEETPELVFVLMQTWEELDRALQISPVYRHQTNVTGLRPPRQLDADAKARFLNMFREELNFVRAARNTAVHSGEIAIGHLRDAVNIGQRLLEILTDVPEAE